VISLRQAIISLEIEPRALTFSAGGFRLYSADDLSTLHFIRALQTLGFSLNEIREFLFLRTNDLRACSEVRKKLDRKLKDIHARRVALVKLEDELKSALTKCNTQLRRPRGQKSGRCPVLTVFSNSKRKGDE
jgi:DNA-binding transcriptional MerR regulator